MVTLIDIEPGMVVAGRYVVSTVDRRWLLDNPEVGAVCTGLDAILDEPVLILVADADGSTDVLEAARRVSILGDPRIAPTLDVGHSNGLDYIVAKRIAVTPLSEILPRSPLPVDAACALIGEVGTALVTSARRGLFHLFLRPSIVGLTSQGGVVIAGIGIDAALALGTGVIDAQDYTPTKASRQDALDLVRLFYTALTGYWPGEEAYDGIPAAEKENSRIARAKSLNPDISNEIDDFVSGIITGSDPGPGSVAEIIGYIGTWDSQLLRLVNRAPVSENDALFEESPVSFDEATSLPTPRAKKIGHGPSRSESASEDQVHAALVRIGITRPGTRGLAAGVVGNTTGRYADRMQMREASSFPIGKEQLDNAAEDWVEWEPEQTYSEYSEYAAHEYDGNLTTPIMDREAQDSDPDTQALDIVVEDEDDDNDTRVIMEDDEDDGSWFLGGMFETNEQQREHQLREYERERRIARAKEEEARRRLAASEADSTAKQQEANRASPPKQMRRLSPETTAEADGKSQGASMAAGADSAVGGGGAGAGRAADGRSIQPTERKAAGSPRRQHSESTAVGGARTTRSKSGPSSNSNTDAKRGSGPGADTTAAGTGGAVAGVATAAGVGTAGTGPGGTASSSGRGSSDDLDPAATRKPFLWLVLGLVVVAAIVIGIVVVNLNAGADSPSPVAESSSPSDSGKEEKKEEKTPKADPPKIKTVESLDPEGDGAEHDSETENVIPDKKGVWNTDRYNSAEFGNLKSGVGLLFEFEDESTVSKVKVNSENSGGKFEIRDGDDPADAKTIGEGVFDSDDGVTVELDEDVETESLILWITELPETDGGYKASINTVTFE